MAGELRPPFIRDSHGPSREPLLSSPQVFNPQLNDESVGPRPPMRPTISRRSTFHEREPVQDPQSDTRKRYAYAAFFLIICLVSFCVQTETAVYIQTHLKWNKAYCMLYFTHGSWIVLWPVTMMIIRIQKWNQPFKPFMRRQIQILRQTAHMVHYQSMHISPRHAARNPWPRLLRTVAGVTMALTCAGGSWYVAVDMTTASDLTAIYNCSAFFAYVFSVPMLHEKVRPAKVFAVAVAIMGVLIIAYGGGDTPPKHGNKSGGGAGGPGHQGPSSPPAHIRFLGNVVIGIGSVLYGFYEVLYKKVACPPEETSPGRGMIFAMAVASMIGAFTLCVLWIPLPILHWMGWEIFELPRGEQAWMMAISVLSNAAFSGSFLVLISLTSPVLSSVAALLTIFIVALVDQLLPPPLNSPLSGAAVVGGILIILAFLLLAWATYREMSEEERRKKIEMDEGDSGDSSLESGRSSISGIGLDNEENNTRK